MSTRNPRDLENREATSRPKMWRPPELLPSPTPIEGWAFRWIRVSSMGEADPSNISLKLREGWEPVKAADHPELKVYSSSTGRFAGCVEIGGLVLAKTPQEFVDQRNAYYGNMNEQQMDTVNNSYFKEFGPETQPFREGKTKVERGSKFGSGQLD